MIFFFFFIPFFPSFFFFLLLEEQEFDLDSEKVTSNSRHMRKEKLTWPQMIYGGGG